MKRFDPSNKHEDGMAPRTDGEWVRYSDHVEAMKRIAAAPVAQGLTPADLEALRDAVDDLDCELSTRYQGYQQDDRRRARDFAVVTRARAILAQSAVTEPLQGTQEPSASAQQAAPVAEVQGSDMVIGRERRNLQWVKGIDPFTFAPGTKLYAAPAPTQGVQEPVAWRHSHTLCLYETREDVPLADGDEWAVPLYLAAPAPSASPANSYSEGYTDAQEIIAFYVADHCENGEHHADVIRRMKRPAGLCMTVEGASPAALTDALTQIGAILGPGSNELHILLACIRNIKHFADCLDAVERAFFMVPGEPDEDDPDSEPGDECLLNRWGSTVEQYVEQFRAAIPHLLAASPADQGEDARDPLEAFKNPMPPFGMLVRALRIVSGTILMEMATDLQLSPATLSAYECGRKPIPPELPRHAADFFARKGIPNTLWAIDAAMSASKEA